MRIGAPNEKEFALNAFVTAILDVAQMPLGTSDVFLIMSVAVHCDALPLPGPSPLLPKC